MLLQRLQSTYKELKPGVFTGNWELAWQGLQSTYKELKHKGINDEDENLTDYSLPIRN